METNVITIGLVGKLDCIAIRQNMFSITFAPLYKFFKKSH